MKYSCTVEISNPETHKEFTIEFHVWACSLREAYEKALMEGDTVGPKEYCMVHVSSIRERPN